MDNIRLVDYIDHTMLTPVVSSDIVKKTCLEAQEYNLKLSVYLLALLHLLTEF